MKSPRYDFPIDEELLNITRHVYRELKIRISNKKIRTKQMNSLLDNYYDIYLTKVIDEYREEAYLNVALKKTFQTDSVSPKIDQRSFPYVSKSQKDFENDLDFQNYIFDIGRHQQHFYQEFHLDENYQIQVDYDFWVPNVVLYGNIGLIVEHIFFYNFEPRKVKAEILQRNTGYIRLLTTSPQMREKLRNEISELRSKNRKIPHENHQLAKGELIGEFFRLLGYEVLITDYLKGFEEFKKLCNIRNVDVVAFSFALQVLILVEETGHFKKKNYHKLETLPNIFEIFSFLEDPSQWRATHLIIASTSKVIVKDVKKTHPDKNILFWNLKTFKEYFSSLLNPDLKLKDSVRFDLNMTEKRPPPPPKPKMTYERIFSNLQRILCQDAKRLRPP